MWKWAQLLSFWAELKLRLSSMNQPWFYDKMSEEWRKENLNVNS